MGPYTTVWSVPTVGVILGSIKPNLDYWLIWKRELLLSQLVFCSGQNCNDRLTDTIVIWLWQLTCLVKYNVKTQSTHSRQNMTKVRPLYIGVSGFREWPTFVIKRQCIKWMSEVKCELHGRYLTSQHRISRSEMIHKLSRNQEYSQGNSLWYGEIKHFALNFRASVSGWGQIQSILTCGWDEWKSVLARQIAQ